MNRMTALSHAADLIGSLLATSRLFIALALIVISLSLPGAASAANDRRDLVDANDVAVDGGTVVADPTLRGTIDVMLNVHGCPAGYDTSAPNYYAAAADCNQPIDPITFHLYDPYSDHVATTSWLWTFTNVSAGKIVIREEIPAGHKQPFAFCHIDQQAWFQAPLYGRDLIQELNYGQYFYCDWFVTPKFSRVVDGVRAEGVDRVMADDPGPAPIQGANAGMRAYLCEDTNQQGDHSHATLANDCSPLADVLFSVSANEAVIGQNVTDDSGSAGLFTLPAGAVEIEGTSDTFDYADTIVYCRSSYVGNGYIGDGVDQQLDSTDNLIQHELVDGETFGCDWFYLVDVSAGVAGGAVSDGGQDATPVADGGSDEPATVTDNSGIDETGADELSEPVQIVARSDS
jgi:hypothetical protein